MLNEKIQKLVFLVLLTVLSGCSASDSWDGVVYPDKGNLLIHRNAGEFQSLEACEDASMAMLESLDGLKTGYYECGKNCDLASSYYNRICDENVRGNLYK